MIEIIVGTKVRFSATFKLLGEKPFDPADVAAQIEFVGGHVMPLGVTRDCCGKYYVTHVVAEEGPFTITFTASSGEFSKTEYVGVPAKPKEVEAPADYEPPPEPITAVATFDRASARRRLMRAGIPVEDSWSDAKVRGALEGLDETERQRRVHG